MTSTSKRYRNTRRKFKVKFILCRNVEVEKRKGGVDDWKLWGAELSVREKTIKEGGYQLTWKNEMGFGKKRRGNQKVDQRHQILQSLALEQGGPLHPHVQGQFNEQRQEEPTNLEGVKVKGASLNRRQIVQGVCVPSFADIRHQIFVEGLQQQ